MLQVWHRDVMMEMFGDKDAHDKLNKNFSSTPTHSIAYSDTKSPVLLQGPRRWPWFVWWGSCGAGGPGCGPQGSWLQLSPPTHTLKYSILPFKRHKYVCVCVWVCVCMNVCVCVYVRERLPILKLLKLLIIFFLFTVPNKERFFRPSLSFYT